MIRLVNSDTLDLAMPRSFQFYHFGAVEKAVTPSAPSPEDLKAIVHGSTVVAFQIYSLADRQRNLMVALFDEALEHQAHVELGNTLASRLAANLGAEVDESILVSPPIATTDEYIEKLLDSGSVSQLFSYVLKSSDGPRAVNVLFFSFRPQMERFHV
ncbi:MAG: hypothetical protein AB7F66_07290 [Bacteriovoracia bacterium]